MKPDDANGHKPTAERPFRVLILAGADGCRRSGRSTTAEGSSPQKQQQIGPNRDVTLRPSKGEGEKLRE
jgi:hypothetical protein